MYDIVDFHDDGFVSDVVFFFKQKTAYEMRISDWSSDVCSSDLLARQREREIVSPAQGEERREGVHRHPFVRIHAEPVRAQFAVEEEAMEQKRGDARRPVRLKTMAAQAGEDAVEPLRRIQDGLLTQIGRAHV